MNLNLKVKKAVVLLSPGTDIILLTLDEATSFPEMKYPPVFKMEARHGYGVEYCQKVLKLKPRIIQA
jgi:hypothetical protein